MDVALSDHLTCPRCGPGYGLILLPDEVRDRWVERGVLGCSNCREQYPVERGVADLRVAGTGKEPVLEGRGGDRESAIRLAGLLGLAEARGLVLVAGPSAVQGPALAGLVGDVEVVVVDGVAGGGEGGRRASPVRVTDVLPFRGRSAMGVALTGARVSLLEEGARVLAPGGRLLLEPSPPDAAARIAAAGLGVVAEEGDVLVATRGR